MNTHKNNKSWTDHIREHILNIKKNNFFCLFYILFLYKKYKYFVFHVFISRNTNITNQVSGNAEK